MYSLKKKVTRNLIINMVLVMCGLLVIMHFAVEKILQDYVLTRLQHDAESLVSVIQKNQDNEWTVDPTHMSRVYNRVRSGHYYKIQIDHKVITSRSLFDAKFPPMKFHKGQDASMVADGPGNESWLIWNQIVVKQKQAMELWVAEDIHPLQKQLLNYSFYAVLLVLVFTSILLLLQQKTLNKAFHVFEQLRQNISSIRLQEQEKTGFQVPLEIMPLVKEIENLVEQLRNRIERTRYAIGNLAHELKRPIQLLSLQQEQEDIPEMLPPLQEIQHIVERELKRAKISGSKHSGGMFNLTEEIPFMIDIMRKIYPEVQVNFTHDEDLVSIDFDRDDMLELVGNLLDNACKFSRQRADLNISKSNNCLFLTFEDDGKGIKSQKIDNIQKRGVRLDETRSGHGLGLSICTAILDSYKGELSFKQSELGGLKVLVKLPITESGHWHQDDDLG
jgi:signal transduction histidine kinase